MYVNYFDRVEKLTHEGPTVGILLCLEKNDTVVKFTLPESSNIFASKYQLYLPTPEQLMQEINNEIVKQKTRMVNSISSGTNGNCERIASTILIQDCCLIIFERVY